MVDMYATPAASRRAPREGGAAAPRGPQRGGGPRALPALLERQVDDDVYVNVAELRQRLSVTEYPDPQYPDQDQDQDQEDPYSYPDPYPDPDPQEEEEEEEEEGWEVHTDQESGQNYYYHPASRRTSWDPPSSPMDPPGTSSEETTTFACTAPRTQGRSPSGPSPSSPTPRLALSGDWSPAPTHWSADWKQLVDETSGRRYFYNAMSGETSWEPPEGAPRSPYPPGGRRALEGGDPPPLPDEDYPSEDYRLLPPAALRDDGSVPRSPHSPAPDYNSHVSPLAPPAEDYDSHVSPLTPPTEDYSFSHGSPHSPAQEYNLGHVFRPVIPRASLDRNAPEGWTLSTEPDGTWVFTCLTSQEQWIKSLDDRGQTYYYLRDGSRSQWTLPEAPVSWAQGAFGNGVESDGVSNVKNWRHTMGPGQMSAHDDVRFLPTHRRNLSDHGVGDSPSSLGQTGSESQQHHVQNLEKAGILNKTKVCEHGKKVRKNWGQSWTVLHGGVLTFHKDPKSANTGASSKTNQIVPEVTVELRGATIGWAARDKSSKKNVIELKSRSGVEFLIQYDNDSIISDWHKVIVDTIRQLEYQDQQSEEEDDLCAQLADRDDRPVATLDKRKAVHPAPTSSRQSVPSSSSHPPSVGETDQKKVRTKLIKFLMKRPTMQSLKDKGYIRDNVFGCPLATLCAQERSTVPSFVEKCINAVETRGLDIDGLYRVSGNLAVIQKLRYKADHEELDLEDGQWDDVHVITGALKLFFRELPEPLFPFSHFNDFITAIRTQDYSTKVSYMRQLVRSLPPPNRHTMDLLFGHLRKVIEVGEQNRMTVQNVAIVFGPTLLRPETESSNITMNTVFQNHIVETVLTEYQYLFHAS